MAKLKETIGTTANNILDGVTVASSVAVNTLVVMDSWLSELYNADSNTNSEAMAKHKQLLLGAKPEAK